MPRTIVISDTHIGSHSHPSTLEREQPLQRLLETVSRFDRLVLLGDIVEMRETRPAESMAVAEAPLRALGLALRRDQHVIVVPGNHDRALIDLWIGMQGATLPLEAQVPLDATPLLWQLTGWLGAGGATVEVRYPGVALSESVWATHGHYLDRHLMPVSPYGLIRGPRKALPRGRALPADYERTRRVELSQLSRWLPRPLRAVLEDVFELGRAATMPQIKQRLLHPRLAPMTARVLGMQMRRHSLPALWQVLHRLGVSAEYVVFGHVHRLGPLAPDDLSQWQAPPGLPRFVNTGSWRYEPLLVHGVRGPHPYWPGGAVVLEDGTAPQAIGLLDDLSAAQLN